MANRSGGRNTRQSKASNRAMLTPYAFNPAAYNTVYTPSGVLYNNNNNNKKNSPRFDEVSGAELNAADRLTRKTPVSANTVNLRNLERNAGEMMAAVGVFKRWAAAKRALQSPPGYSKSYVAATFGNNAKQNNATKKIPNQYAWPESGLFEEK